MTDTPLIVLAGCLPALRRVIAGSHRDLGEAFTWTRTPQGHRYWADICAGETYPSVEDIEFLISVLRRSEAAIEAEAIAAESAAVQARRDEAFRVAAAAQAVKAIQDRLEITSPGRQRIAVAGVLIQTGNYKLAAKCLEAHKELFIREVFDSVVKAGHSGMNNYKFALNCLNRGECMAKYASYKRLIKLTDETVEALR